MAITALAVGPACMDGEEEGSSRRPLLGDEGDNGGRPATPVTGMTTYDRSAAVPGFAVSISLGGESGEDVELDWSSTGFSGDVIVYRSADPSALLDITVGGPVPAGVEATPLSGTLSYTDVDAASHTVATPHYFYRVARVGQGGQGGGSGEAAYLRSQAAGPPWGQNTNEQAMDMQFGAGAWDDLRYETVDVGSLLSSQYSFIYMEGGDSNANELEVFLANNMIDLEEWVDGGGALFLNSAPNEGGNQSWGFGGVTLNYYDFPTDPGHAVDPSHAIWNGPFTPTATQFTGSYYAHATVSGPGLVPHILDADGGYPNLAELDWGLGHVMFGGLTTSNFWGPPDEALNLRANIIDYVAGGGGATGPQLSTMVMKTTTATYPGFNRFGLCMLDGPSNASDIYAQFDGVLAVHQWNAYTQSYMSWTPGNGTPDYPLLYGSAVVAQLDGEAAAYHSLVGVVPTTEALAVSGQPGYNWTTLPVFYNGPTSTDYWLSVAGYWGVGQWHNDTQSSQFDWNDPGYDPFEMEPCGAYDLYLPNNACVSNGDCGEDQFCFFVEPASCGEVAAGLCFPTPLGCEEVPESPVCGCDGETYANQCEAELGGVATRRPEGEVPCNVQPVCGDGNVDPGEQCDGGNLAGATCVSQGFVGGSLGCTEECTYDTSSCVPQGGGGGGFECVEEDIGSAVGNAVTSGSTVGEDEDLAQPCGAGGVDHVIHFVAPSNGTYEFNMIGSSYDTVLSLHAECGQAALTCNDDWYGLQSRVDLSMTAGQEVLIAVSGYAGGTGNWVLNIISGEPGFCGDGNIDPGEQCDSGNLGEASCASEGYAGGELGCNAECTYDTSGCVPYGGGGGESCESGNDPYTGSEWVVCTADQNQAWISHSNAGGGNYHPQLICESLGYAGYGSYGGTCGNVCGYCEGPTSCEAPGNQNFDGAGDCGSDEGGPVLCYTVMWQCFGGLPS